MPLSQSFRSFHCAKCLFRHRTILHRRLSKKRDNAAVGYLPIAGFSTDTLKSHPWTEPVGYNTGIRVYNSLTKQKQKLILPRGKYLSWYSCGPTVYDKSHIGHACNYVRFDILRRILTNFFDLNVTYMMGVTDIDDKIIRKALELEQEFTVITTHYEREFFQEMLALNVLQPTIKFRVTENIPEILDFIQQIIDRGHGYKTDDGSVYFDVKKFGSYHKFGDSGMVADTSLNPGVKHDVRDFALWKASKVGEPYWQSPWGPGRPGWHIECSAMASRIFGKSIDIHSGGVDLKFPHHENELAQSCSFHQVDQWANYWIHTGFLHLSFDPEKMSKSLKNVIPTSDLLKKYTANQFRMFCMLRHYRSNIEFNDEQMNIATNLDNQIGHFLRICDDYVKGQLPGGVIPEAEIMRRLAENETKTLEYLADDFRTQDVITNLIQLIQFVRPYITQEGGGARSNSTINSVSVYVKRLCKKLGFHKKGWRMSKEPDNMKLKEVLDDTIKFRWNVRQFAMQSQLPLPDSLSAKEKKKERNKFFAPLLQSSDELRSQLGNMKISVEDHKTYSSWEFVDSGNVSDESPWDDTDNESPSKSGDQPKS